MIDYYEYVPVSTGTKIRVHPAEGEPFVAEAVQAAENSCDDCALFKEDINCQGLYCPAKVIFKKVDNEKGANDDSENHGVQD